jgi:hypothetical protein
MKGVTLIIILSVVWSIISGIIEKKKAAAKKEAAKRGVSTADQPTVSTQLKADPVQVKIESLRRRTKAKVQQPPPQSKPIKEEAKRIPSLHVDTCPLPPSGTPTKKETLPSKQLSAMLQNSRNIRTAIVLSEILGKPVSQRNGSQIY